LKTSFSFQKILAAFFVFIGLLLAIRIYYTGKLLYLFLVWNIFLAWIPFMLSSLFEKMSNKSIWIRTLVICSWLAFFPNALYIVTDLVHLQIESTVPKWFDAVLLFSASVVGLMMAFISLYRVENHLLKTVNKKTGQALIMMILFMGSFGVYLGRFLRWNSWDIISNPAQLLMSIGHRIVSPFDHVNTWAVTIIFTTLFYLLYTAVKKLPGYMSQAS